jgi:hypothetical protein
MTVSTLTVWIVMGAVASIFLRQSSTDRAWAVAASILACLITIWAWDRASTANDFLTATSTTRLICIAYLLLTIYGPSQQWGGLAWIEWPAPIDTFITNQFSLLIGPIGIVTMLLTDYLRAFTVPTKPGNLLGMIRRLFLWTIWWTSLAIAVVLTAKRRASTQARHPGRYCPDHRPSASVIDRCH